jgi:hypothetical protein
MGMEIFLQCCLNSALDVSGWSKARVGLFILGKQTRYLLCRRLGDTNIIPRHHGNISGRGKIYNNNEINGLETL